MARFFPFILLSYCARLWSGPRNHPKRTFIAPVVLSLLTVLSPPFYAVTPPNILNFVGLALRYYSSILLFFSFFFLKASFPRKISLLVLVFGTLEEKLVFE